MRKIGAKRVFHATPTKGRHGISPHTMHAPPLGLESYDCPCNDDNYRHRQEKSVNHFFRGHPFISSYSATIALSLGEHKNSNMIKIQGSSSRTTCKTASSIWESSA